MPYVNVVEDTFPRYVNYDATNPDEGPIPLALERVLTDPDSTWFDMVAVKTGEPLSAITHIPVRRPTSFPITVVENEAGVNLFRETQGLHSSRWKTASTSDRVRLVTEFQWESWQTLPDHLAAANSFAETWAGVRAVESARPHQDIGNLALRPSFNDTFGDMLAECETHAMAFLRLHHAALMRTCPRETADFMVALGVNAPAQRMWHQILTMREARCAEPGQFVRADEMRASW